MIARELAPEFLAETGTPRDVIVRHERRLFTWTWTIREYSATRIRRWSTEKLIANG